MMKTFRKGRLSHEGIMQWLLDMRHNCYAPESGFCATVVMRASLGGDDDYYFAGVNAENADHGIGTHAEEGAIAAMVTGLGRKAEIAEIWVMGAPSTVQAHDENPAAEAMVFCCGQCRQQIAGFAAPGAQVHYFSLNGKMSSTTVVEFLPDLFTFRQFIPDITAIKGPNAAAAIAAEDVSKRLLRSNGQDEKEIFAWLRGIESVDYASNVSQSVVLELDNGAYAAGVKIEEAAFVSTNAAQSALAVATAEFAACRIRQAWVYTEGRNGKEIPEGSFGALPMSALQTILQRAVHAEIPIGFFAPDGSIIRATIIGAARLAPTSSHPFHKKP